MTTYYNNIPQQITNNANNQIVQAFNAYFSSPVELDGTTLDMMTSFFTTRGFDISAAQSVATLLIIQAKKDNYNPLQILDTLKGLDSVELSALVAEVINYNRYKTSFLGYALEFTPNTEVSRNVL